MEREVSVFSIFVSSSLVRENLGFGGFIFFWNLVFLRSYTFYSEERERKIHEMRKVILVIGILTTFVYAGETRFLRSGDNPGPPDANGCCNPRGCTNRLAINYDAKAIDEDGSCVFPKPMPKDMASDETTYQYYHSELDPENKGIFESTYTRAVRRMKGRMREDSSLDPLSQGDDYSGTIGIGSVEGNVMKPPVSEIKNDQGDDYGGYSDMWPRPINIPPVKGIPVTSDGFRMTGG